MDEILFYIISVCLFCVIIKEIMGIFFVKKDVPVLIFIIVWIMFLLIDIIGVKFIIEPIFLLGIESVNSFCFCMFLYQVKSKFVCKFIFQLCGFIYATFIFKRFD